MILKDAINDKEYLSNKEIEEIFVDESVTRIGNWAFAHAKNLKKITLPANEIALGKDAFLDCGSLSEVVIYPDESGNESLSRILAKAITVLNDDSLFNPKEAAGCESHKSWIKKFDDKLVEYVSERDDLGFSPVLIGWFDDTGEDEQKENYKKKKQEEKARLCFFRLKYDTFLSEEHFKKIKEYVKNHMQVNYPTETSGTDNMDVRNHMQVNYPTKVPGADNMDVRNHMQNNNSAYQVLCKEYYNDIETVKALEEAGIFSKEIRNEFISVLSEKNANPEIVAYLVNKASLEEVGLDKDAFEEFEL